MRRIRMQSRWLGDGGVQIVVISERRELADSRWWLQFNDPVLVDLVATARIEEFSGQYGIVRVDFFPLVYRSVSAVTESMSGASRMMDSATTAAERPSRRMTVVGDGGDV